MQNVHFRPADPERDFSILAAWFTLLEGVLNTEQSLKKYYADEKERIIQKLAQDDSNALKGFYWAIHDLSKADVVHFELYVEPKSRSRGIGESLFNDMLQIVSSKQAITLWARVYDDCDPGFNFAIKHGFQIHHHTLGMTLDLTNFDDQPYQAIIHKLEGEGFRFTSMAELGNDKTTQRQLYLLNDTTAMETMGGSGEHSWESFEAFQQEVCQAEWYDPAGQLVVIDTKTGEFVAMSAITRFTGSDAAYNLHTGVDKRYRGRKLAQAVKVMALCYARDVLNVTHVQTHHLESNVPMIAIDRKLGYTQSTGYYRMVKYCNQTE